MKKNKNLKNLYDYHFETECYLDSLFYGMAVFAAPVFIWLRSLQPLLLSFMFIPQWLCFALIGWQYTLPAVMRRKGWNISRKYVFLALITGTAAHVYGWMSAVTVFEYVLNSVVFLILPVISYKKAKKPEQVQTQADYEARQKKSAPQQYFKAVICIQNEPENPEMSE